MLNKAHPHNLFHTLRMGNVHPLEINDELERFVVIVGIDKNFVTYIYRKQLLKFYPNLSIDLRVFLSSFGGRCREKFQQVETIKIFHRSTMKGERHYIISIISIKRA